MQPEEMVSRRPMEPSVLSALRDATAVLHTDIEGHPLLRPLLSPQLDRRQFALLLCAFREFFALVEPTILQGLPPELPQAGYVYHPRLPLVVADLADVTDAPPIDAGLCAALAVPEPGNSLGMLYVIEGATQGGRVISPHLQERLGLDAHRGARYFHVYQYRQWPVLRAVLSQPGSEELADVVTTAQNTFRLLHRVLDQVCIARQGHG